MRASGKAKALAAAAAAAARAIEKPINKRSAPILQALRVTTTDAGLVFTGSNRDQQIAATAAAEVGEVGEVVVPAERLADLAAGLAPDATVTLTSDGTTLAITTGRSHWRLPTLPVADFPARLGLRDGADWIFPMACADRQRNALQRCDVHVRAGGQSGDLTDAAAWPCAGQSRGRRMRVRQRSCLGAFFDGGSRTRIVSRSRRAICSLATTIVGGPCGGFVVFIIVLHRGIVGSTATSWHETPSCSDHDIVSLDGFQHVSR